MKILKFAVNKLVRDKIVERGIKKNIVSDFKVMNDEEYIISLKEKIMEEAKEVAVSQTRENLIEEIADLQEVIKALCKVENISQDTIESVRVKKMTEKGAFNGKIFIKSFSMAEDHPDISLYRNTKCEIEEN